MDSSPGSEDREDGGNGGTYNALAHLLSRALEAQWRRAASSVAGHRRRSPDVSADEIAQRLVDEFVRDVTAVGALGGAVAAVPGPGTALKLTAGTVVETSALLERASFMILGVAEAYGHDLVDIEVRRFAVLRVLGTWAGVADGVTGVAGTMGAGLGKKATKAIPISTIHRFNGAMGKQVLFKWSTRVGTIRLGSVLPFGIGAGIGGTTSYFLAKGMGRVAIKELRPL